jgi:hypothetical protein
MPTALSASTLPALVAFAVLAPVTVAPVEAQARRQDRGRFELGPLHLTPAFRVTSGVDTNVFQTLREPTRDAVVVLSPRLDGALPVGKRLRLTGLGFIDAFYFRRQEDERSLDFYGEAQAELLLGALTVFGGGGGGQFHQRFSIDVDERIKRQEKRAHAGLTLLVSRKLSATVRGLDEVFTFAPGEFRLGGDVKEAMDRNTRTATGQLRVALTGRTTLLASADVVEDHFFSQPSYVPVERRSYRYLGGFEFGTRAAVSGRLLAGGREFPGTLADGSPPYRGPVISADLSLPLGSFARLHAVAERDVSYASSLVRVGALRYRNAFIYERYLGEAVLDLPLQLLAFLSAGFEESRYLLPYPYPDPLSLNPRVDHRYTAGASLLRRFGESLRIGGHLVWARRVSSLPDFSYEGLRYGFTAEVRP